MPDNEQTLIEKAGRVLSSASAQAIMDAFNATAGATNKLMELLKRAGIEQIAEQAPEEEPPAEGEDEAMMEDAEAMMEEEEKPEEKMVMRPTQADANYVTISTKRGQACANCRWFSAHHHDMDMQGMAYCHLIDNWPDDILPTGYCDRWEGKPEYEPEPLPVTIVEAESKARKEYASFIQRVKSALQRNTNSAPDDFIVYKGLDGKPRWFARHTNNFEDLEGDIFAEKAHDKYIARLNAGLVPMPYLSFWHLQGTEHGQADRVMRDGHIVMAWGKFDETPFALKCLKFYQKNKGRIKLSQGAYVPKHFRKAVPGLKGRLYTDYNALHITTLPPVIAKAANPYTTFSEDMIMALKPEQKEFLVKEFGQDEADRIERDNETLNKTLEQLVQFKDFADLVTKAEDKPAADIPNATAASLFADLVKDQALVIKVAEGVAKHQQETDATIETLRKELETVKANADKALAELALAPRRASESPKTALTTEEAAQVQKEIPRETDEFWGGLGIPKADKQ